MKLKTILFLILIVSYAKADRCVHASGGGPNGYNYIFEGGANGNTSVICKDAGGSKCPFLITNPGDENEFWYNAILNKIMNEEENDVNKSLKFTNGSYFLEYREIKENREIFINLLSK
jgi:hypothetical protein